jgi:hypothetical protein
MRRKIKKNRAMSHIFRILSIALLGIILLSACQAAPPAAVGNALPTPTAVDLKAAAYTEATRISQAGEATAIVQAAHATANALTSQISEAIPTSAPVLPTVRPTDADFPPPAAVPALTVTPAQTVSPTPVEVLSVGFGADGVLIVIQFKASPRVAQGWFQGSFSVTDEATGSVYSQVSVAPIIGPLISRPREEGRSGYAMLVNQDDNQKGGLKGGELVTVTLGDYRFEHVMVEKQE